MAELYKIVREKHTETQNSEIKTEQQLVEKICFYWKCIIFCNNLVRAKEGW